MARALACIKCGINVAHYLYYGSFTEHVMLNGIHHVQQDINMYHKTGLEGLGGVRRPGSIVAVGAADVLCRAGNGATPSAGKNGSSIVTRFQSRHKHTLPASHRGQPKALSASLSWELRPQCHQISIKRARGSPIQSGAVPVSLAYKNNCTGQPAPPNASTREA